MRNPRIGQMVWANELDGTFTVVRIYASQGVADLESTSGSRRVRMHVPFTVIHPVGEDLTPQVVASPTH